MAKGVSGALTRLAKVNAAGPGRSGSGQSRPSPRGRVEDGEDDDVFYLPEDIEDLSARQFVRRRPEPRAEPAPAPAPVVAPVPPAQPVVYAESGRQRPVKGVRVESPEIAESDDDDEMSSAGRGVRRIAQRIRRIKTALAARVGRESEPEPATIRRGDTIGERAAGSKGAGHRSVVEDDSDLDRSLRGSIRPKQLARVRRRLGMTQAEFARCFGLDADDVVRWEAGGRLSRAERVLLTLIMHDPEETARLVDEAMPLK